MDDLSRELQEWKIRALRAERLCRSLAQDLLRAEEFRQEEIQTLYETLGQALTECGVLRLAILASKVTGLPPVLAEKGVPAGPGVGTDSDVRIEIEEMLRSLEENQEPDESGR